MNIFKTFELFLKEPLSILRNNWIQLVNLETDNIFAHKPSCEVSVMKDKTQITIINNEKMYNLLSLVTRRAELKAKEKQKV